MSGDRVRLDDFNTVPARLPTLDAGELAVLLDELEAFLRRFVVFGDPQAVAVVLWVLHTHAHDAFDVSPYLAVMSPEKRSGKSRLLALLELVVARPWRVVTPSEAVLYRKIERDHPTLLLDEVDAIFGGKSKSDNNREGLRALLNAGNERGVIVPRCLDHRSKKLDEFSTYGPKALAGIGQVPDTVADRSIPIAMKRRTRAEPVERFRRRELAPFAAVLRDALAAWAAASLEALEHARPSLPVELDDRIAEAWEPLLAIADAAGDTWARRGRAAALELSAGEQRDDDSLGVRLLVDARRVFDERDVDRIATADLLAALAADDEAPWASFGRTGKPLTANRLARLLRYYEVRSRTIRLDDDSTAKGYLRSSFEDAWHRYVTAVSDSEASQRHNPHGYAENSTSAPSHRDGSESGANPHGCGDVTALPFETLVSRNETVSGKPGDPVCTTCATSAASSGQSSGEWLARDGRWRCIEHDPPAVAGEVVETREPGIDNR